MFWVQGLKKLWCRFRILIHVPFFSGPPGDTYQMDLSLGLFTVFTQKFPVISTIWIPSFILFCFSTICICFFFFLDRIVRLSGWSQAPSAAKGELELTIVPHHC